MAVAEKAIEVAADVVEEVAEESAEIAVATRGLDPRNLGFFFGGTGVGVVAGYLVTHFLVSKVIKAKYEKIADDEILEMKKFYNSKLRALENEKEKATLELVEKDIEERQEGDGQTPYHAMYQGGSEPDKPAQDGVVVQNVFVEASEDPEVPTDGWSYEEELKNRDPKVPYVIHQDEFGEDLDGYEPYVLTYFEGDDVLCRDDDTIITEVDAVVGLGNLSKFGHGSGDPNIVYIRNEEMKVQLEVVHSDGKYAKEVAGFDDTELQHSSMRRRSPRRSEYDTDR